VSDEYKPITRDDVADPGLVVGALRALQVEMRTGFELVLEQIARFSERLTSLEMHRTDANQRHDRHERHIADHEHRIAALEAALKPKA
jgi:hypothetical protein